MTAPAPGDARCLVTPRRCWLVGGMPQAAPEAETPGHRETRAALAIAVDALQRAKFCTDDKLAAMARETLAEIGRLTYDAEFAADAASLDTETFRREGAEEKLAEAVLMLGEIREYAQTWITVAMRLSTPQTRAEADCGRKILDLIDADAPTDDDESPRPPRTTDSERNRP
jgi:hypothetical protein